MTSPKSSAGCSITPQTPSCIGRSNSYGQIGQTYVKLARSFDRVLDRPPVAEQHDGVVVCGAPRWERSVTSAQVKGLGAEPRLTGGLAWLTRQRRTVRLLWPRTPRLRPKGTEHVGSGLPLTSTPDVGLSCQISWSSLPFCSAHPSSLLRRPAQLLALRPALIVQSVLKRLPSLEP